MNKYITAFLFFFVSGFAFCQPALQWKQIIKTGITSINTAVCMAVDKADNCYIAGTSQQADSTKNLLLVKYDAKGTEQWRRLIYSDDGLLIFPTAICTDKNEDVIICGNTKTTSGTNDILLMKYSSAGNQEWKIIYGGNANLNDGATCLTTDKHGNIFVGGFVSVSQANMDLVILKCNTIGKLQWTKYYSTPQTDIANAFATDDSCNIYTAGNVNNGIRSSDIIIMKCDSSGNLKWDYVYDGSARAIDFSTSVSLDDSASVFVTGSSNHAADHADVPLLKFSRDGKFVSETFYNGKLSDCMGKSIKADRKKVLLCISVNDYIKGINTGILISYDKMCNEKKRSNSPEVNYYRSATLNNFYLCAGTKPGIGEGMLIPYMEQKDTSLKNLFTLADSTVMGMTHMKDVLIKSNSIYFLGDDATPEAGTISLMKYSIPLPEEKKKAKKPELDEIKLR